uniref:trans-3-hydroxy-L-proline dehydratase n=1 Tax=Myxine glutinosa TaxID=7769 RepID=UPI00358E3D56
MEVLGKIIPVPEELLPRNGPRITVVDMHTGGEPLRIVLHGFPPIPGKDLLSKRHTMVTEPGLDRLRRALMLEPRGHAGMYGALLVPPDDPSEADLAVLFMHCEGYSTMCGHAVIALARFAVDSGLVEKRTPETPVSVQCPCGVVRALVQCDAPSQNGRTRFRSIPAFAFATDVTINVPGHGDLIVDIGYGGAFYAVLSASTLGLDVRTSRTSELTAAATTVSRAVREQVKLSHPDNEDLAFLYGTILTDGNDDFTEIPTANICVFADAQVDRCPTGSGVTARIALQYRKGQIGLGQTRSFESSATHSQFTGRAVEETQCGPFPAVTVEVSGEAFYTGFSTFILEAADPLCSGFLLP